MTGREAVEAGRMLRYINATRQPYKQARIAEFRNVAWPVTHDIATAYHRMHAVEQVERLLAGMRRVK